MPISIGQSGAIFLASNRKAVIFSYIWSLRAFNFLLLGLYSGLIRLLHLPQSRQLRRLNHHLLSLTGGVGMHLFLEVEKLPA
jgi:hypothetical protein